MKLNASKLNINIIECKTFCSRLRGFMFKLKKIDYGLLFKNCNSIHTIFMLQSIDIIGTDKDNNILYMEENIKPFKFVNLKKEVKWIYELPLGSVKKLKNRD